jgi:kinesin family protein 11
MFNPPRNGLKSRAMAPPNHIRKPLNRPQSATPTLTGRASPADSVTSSASRMRSPTSQLGGTKRKERDFDHDGGEETNINVVVRCRGRNDREVRENSGVVVSADGKGKSVELSMGPSALSNKTYQFDKVFSPAADQIMIFDEVVSPILDEVCYCLPLEMRITLIRSLGSLWIELHHFCIRPDWHRKNIHHVWRHHGYRTFTR